MKEQWKPVSGFPGYEVSSLGRIRSVPRVVPSKNRWGKPGVRHYGGKLLKTDKSLQKGYENAYLSGKILPIHRLVAAAFIGDIPKGMSVNHKNGVRRDNRVENLEIVSHKDNVRHAHITGLRKSTKFGAILTKEDVRAIRFFWPGSTREGKDIMCKIFNKTHGHLGKVSSRKLYGYIS